MTDHDKPVFSGATSAEGGFRSLQYRLDSWNRYVVGTSSYYRYVRDDEPIPPDAITQFEMDLRHETERLNRDTEYCSRYTLSQKDERPYFYDPCPLAFEPAMACAEDDGEGEEGVRLADVWRDPLARTLWLAIKARYLTSQYFRGACLQQAEWLRRKPPVSADEMHIDTGSGETFGGLGIYFRCQLWPYIAFELQRENHWPYFGVPPAIRVHKSLGWVYRKPKQRDEPHVWRDRLFNSTPEQFANCSFCYKPHDDVIHIEGPRLEGH